MRRFHRPFILFTAVSTSAACAVAGFELGGCSSVDAGTFPGGSDAGVGPKDGGIVQPPDGGADDAAAPGEAPSCKKYCSLVMASCTGSQAQYASTDDCLAFCGAFPAGDAGDESQASLACRQYFASTPAETNPEKYCTAAGPYGGGVCGDRCAAFCQVAVSECSSGDGGSVPFPSYPDCETACTNYPYVDAGPDGGGDGMNGPATGNTLNCRLYQLRQIVSHNQGCSAIDPSGGPCE
jgi:hypothetical protein